MMMKNNEYSTSISLTHDLRSAYQRKTLSSTTERLTTVFLQDQNDDKTHNPHDQPVSFMHFVFPFQMESIWSAGSFQVFRVSQDSWPTKAHCG